MGRTRRIALFTLLASAALTGQNQDSQEPNRRLPIPPNPDEDKKLPNGKSQKNAIAKEDHEQALKDANDLIAVAQQLRDELQKAGDPSQISPLIYNEFHQVGRNYLRQESPSASRQTAALVQGCIFAYSKEQDPDTISRRRDWVRSRFVCRSVGRGTGGCGARLGPNVQW